MSNPTEKEIEIDKNLRARAENIRYGVIVAEYRLKDEYDYRYYICFYYLLDYRTYIR